MESDHRLEEYQRSNFFGPMAFEELFEALGCRNRLASVEHVSAKEISRLGPRVRIEVAQHDGSQPFRITLGDGVGKFGLGLAAVGLLIVFQALAGHAADELVGL